MSINWKKTKRVARKVFLWLAVAILVVPVILVLIFKWAPVRYTPLMMQRYMEGRADSKHASQEWVDYDKISPNLARAVISSEDNLFAKHSGFAFGEIRQAWLDSRKGKRLRGGSTISQQCAKNVFLPHSRSYIRKAYEAYFTVLIEWIWGKRRIMEVYLNVIEMGPGVYGAEAAAQKYFNVPASKLSQQQCALIAACLPNPRKFLVAKPSAYIQQRQQKILGLMPKMGKIELE